MEKLENMEPPCGNIKENREYDELLKIHTCKVPNRKDCPYRLKSGLGPVICRYGQRELQEESDS